MSRTNLVKIAHNFHFNWCQISYLVYLINSNSVMHTSRSKIGDFNEPLVNDWNSHGTKASTGRVEQFRHLGVLLNADVRATTNPGGPSLIRTDTVSYSETSGNPWPFLLDHFYKDIGVLHETDYLIHSASTTSEPTFETRMEFYNYNRNQRGDNPWAIPSTSSVSIPNAGSALHQQTFSGEQSEKPQYVTYNTESDENVMHGYLPVDPIPDTLRMGLVR